MLREFTEPVTQSAWFISQDSGNETSANSFKFCAFCQTHTQRTVLMIIKYKPTNAPFLN